MRVCRHEQFDCHPPTPSVTSRRVHPDVFKLGPFPIHWYGVLVALGFLAGLWTASRRGLRDGIAAEKIIDAGPWLIVGGIAGARALYVISYWQEKFANGPWTEIFMVQKGGLVFYGGLLGAGAGGLIYVLKNGLPLWKFADTLAPSIALGYVPGRLGCLMNGCCYGQACDWPWALHFPAGHDTHGHGVHPTQIYDSLLNLALYFALAWWYRRKEFDGQVFAAYLMGYAFTRSVVEMFRGDYPAHYLGGWATPAHLISFAILATGAVLFWKLPRRSANKI